MTEKKSGENKIPVDIKAAVEKQLQNKRVRIEEKAGTPEAADHGNPIVYSTETGQAPRGSVTLTTEATTPIPPPTKVARKTTTKKHKPRVVAKAQPLHKEIKVDKRVLDRAREIMAEGRYQRMEIVDNETVIVR